MSPPQFILRMDSSISSIIKSLKVTLRRRRRISSRTKVRRCDLPSTMSIPPIREFHSDSILERKPRSTLRLHLQRTRTTLSPEDQSSLVSAFEELTEAYGYLEMELQRVIARIGHLERSLKALKARQATSHCRLGINTNIDQFTSELTLRKEEEHILFQTLNRMAKELGDLGKF